MDNITQIILQDDSLSSGTAELLVGDGVRIALNDAESRIVVECAGIGSIELSPGGVTIVGKRVFFQAPIVKLEAMTMNFESDQLHIESDSDLVITSKTCDIDTQFAQTECGWSVFSAESVSFQ